MNRLLAVTTVVVSLFVGSFALAAPLDAPTGRVLLTVRGEITQTNSDGAALFDRAMLETLDWQQFETETAWTDGRQQFAGVALADVMAAVGAEGRMIRAIALNDYSIRIPLADMEPRNIMLALDRNGKPMRVRDKGPIWVIFPDSVNDINKAEIQEMMIWQLVTIEVEA